jgi:benzoate/toluate 1,2-dioxygenase subunit alpha
VISTPGIPIAEQSFGDLVQDDRVHRLVYTDPHIFDVEMTSVFASTWVYVGHESEIAGAGDYKTTTIGRQPIIMARDDAGEVHVLFNRCMHRGAVVCLDEHGTTQSFRCLYHGWTYDNSGALVGVPYRTGYGGEFDASRLGLVRVPRVGSYRGFVFACLNPEGEPFETYLGRARAYLDSVVDWSPEGELVVTPAAMKYSYRGNWKLMLENWADNYHPAFTHEAQFERTRIRTGVRQARGDEGADNVDLGHGHAMIDFGTEDVVPSVDSEHRTALEKRVGVERANQILRCSINLCLFPNLLFRTAGPYFLVIKPVAVDFTEVYAYSYQLKGPAQQFNARAVRRPPTAASVVQTDDSEAFERIMEGLRVTSVEWVLFDRGLHRERVLPNGEVRGPAADEVGHRGQHREYRRLMLQQARRCCVGGVCRGPRAETAEGTA